jgi:hypothetical protein
VVPGTERKAGFQFNHDVGVLPGEFGRTWNYYEIRPNPDGLEPLIAPFVVRYFPFFQLGQIDKMPDQANANVDCRSPAFGGRVDGQPTADRYPRSRVGRFTFIGIEPAGPLDGSGAFAVQVEKVGQGFDVLWRRFNA